MSRIYDELQRIESLRARPSTTSDWHGADRPFRVLTLTSNKGGVGKTTIAANLAVYLRAAREDLPILLLSLDDQPVIDRMFALDDEVPKETIRDALRAGSLGSAIRMGRYGVHYVPTARDSAELKREVLDPFQLRRLLAASGWRGLVIVDTKSDLEILTQNAIAAADLSIVVVKDQISLLEARRVYELLRQWNLPRERARVLLALLDLRVKYADSESRDIHALLLGGVRRLGYPQFATYLSRSPKIESLYTNPAGRQLSVLHAAPGSLVHRQLRQLAVDVLEVLPMDGPADRG